MHPTQSAKLSDLKKLVNSLENSNKSRRVDQQNLSIYIKACDFTANLEIGRKKRAQSLVLLSTFLCGQTAVDRREPIGQITEMGGEVVKVF